MNSAGSNEISDLDTLVEVSTPRSMRLDWIDYAKGIAIILVVYGHVLIGIYNAGLNIPYFFYIYSLKFVYSFHMPVFFFLAGMFFDRSWSNSFYNFLSKKIKTVAYPYVLWSTIQGSIYALMSTYTNFKFDLNYLPLAIAFDPLNQFWFLYVLFVHHVIFAAIRKFIKAVCYLAIPLCILMYFISPYIDFLLLNKVLRFFVYYVLGAFTAKLFLEKDWMLLNGKQLLSLGLAFLFFQSMFLEFDGSIDDATGNLLNNFLMACSGIAFTLSLSIYLYKQNIMNFVRYLGFLSMPIYLVHVLATVGTRIVLQKGFNINNPITHILVETIAALAFPIFLYLIMQRLKFPYLFSLNNK